MACQSMFKAKRTEHICKITIYMENAYEIDPQRSDNIGTKENNLVLMLWL